MKPSARTPLGDHWQAAAEVVLVRPAAFGFNPETAGSNRFQRRLRGDLQARADGEFMGVVAALRRAGVGAHVLLDAAPPRRPDAVFPNNWVSFHGDGTVVIYPLAAASRRAERRSELLDELASGRAFRVRRVLDLSGLEHRRWHLEGTGSLVLDRLAHVAYAALSPRTHPEAVRRFAAASGYRAVTFDACGPGGIPVYHTNVMLTLGARFAIACADAIATGDRRRVLAELVASGRDITLIDRSQMGAFAGNCLELVGRDGPCLLVSAGAWQSLRRSQRRRIERYATPVPVAIPTIERAGGGSVRCMVAEVFLPTATGWWPSLRELCRQ
jgi:hypothetical protein